LVLLGFILERDNFGKIVKKGTLYGAGAGLMNGAMNFLNLVVYIFIPISMATSVRTGLGIIASFLVSVVIYREKFTLMQALSAAMGIAAVLLLQFSDKIMELVKLI
jgi:multidrug transporter EmrE-like cation transporter